METQLFDVKLVNHNIFKTVKNGLAAGGENLKNVMELKDDVLFVWHSTENCLLTLNLKHLDNKDLAYQKLIPLQPPAFAVERLLVNSCCTHICSWGPRGATIIELPQRWGRGGFYDGGKEAVPCKSFAVDERFLYAQGEVRRVHWHSSSVSHLLVLVSDNTIRLYNTALRTGPKLVKILNTGPKPSGLLAGKKLLESLGDTAVDFTPAPESNSLLILRGNGDVYMINCEIDSKSPIPPKLCGPLTMYPPADDNYGEDSCSITALGGGDTPPVIVIATCSALLYHCLLLPESNNNDLNESQLEKKNGNGYALYVVEAVELNIVLSPDDDQLQYSYPVHLYPSIGTGESYTIVHAAGVHTVNLPIISQLKEFAMAENDDIETVLSGLCSKPSVARYLLCTLWPGEEIKPPVGFAATQPPLPTLLVLLSDGQLVTRTIEPFHLEEQLFKELQLRNPALEQDDINNILKERQKLSFYSILQEILTRDVSQPILKISKKEEPSPKECLEFLTQATLKLRQEYISRQDRAADAIQKKLVGLESLKKQQYEWYSEVQKDIEDVLLESTVLRDKCMLVEKNQDDIKHRCSAVIRTLRASSSTNAAEKDLLRELEYYKKQTEMLADHIDVLKNRVKDRNEEVKNWKREYKKKDIALGKSHSDTISSILQQQTTQISSLLEETKLLKEELKIF